MVWKKVILISAVMCLAAAGSVQAAETSSAYTTNFGDVVDDGKINVLDMEAIQKSILKLQTLTDKQENIADVNRDGVLTVNDMEAVQKHILSLESIENIDVIETNNTVSVHDPSIIKDHDGTYYIFGSHMAWAKSTDLCNWTTFTNNINTDYDNLFKIEAAWSGKAEKDYKIVTKDNNGNITGTNLWAPDIVWNEDMGKWCMYMSVNGTSWCSSICLLTADSLGGDWTYVGTVIQSGMSMGFGVTFDYTKVTGETTVNSRYTDRKRNNTPTYEPHAIDPCVLYDDNGNLWMSYGSWSGGIGMIKLDNKTGLRDYSYSYKLDETKLTDPYTGYKIAGGNQMSGEASYIQKVGDYYYLFVSYGALNANGGYSMRVFRSESITGDYVDASGDNARYKLFDNVVGSTGYGNINGNVGIKLMTYYKWNTMDVAQVAQGHNSAFVDDDGKAYVIYHTRTNDGTEGHYVKTHQLFVNEDGWLVAAPYRYSGETLNEKGYSVSKVAGTYDVLMHKQSINFGNLEYVSPVEITLSADGKVSGAYTGTWKLKENSPYITITMGGKTYKGVVIRQIIEGTDEDTMCFTLLGSDEMEVWGSKHLTGKRAVEMAVKNLTVASVALDDLDLPQKGMYNTAISWSSSNPSVIATDGTLTKPDTETTVTLIATFENNGITVKKDYQVKVYEAPDNNTDPYVIAKYYINESIDLSKAVEGTYSIPNPFNSANTSGLELYNGAAVEFEVTPTGAMKDVNGLDTILGFTGNTGKLYFTAGSYLGYNAAGGYYDANITTGDIWVKGTDFIGKGGKVRIDFLPTGYKVSVNGTVVYTNSMVDAKTIKGSNSNMQGYNNVLYWLNSTATTFNLGWGSWWNVPFQGTIKNIVFYAYPVEKIDTSQYAYYQDYRKGGSEEWTAVAGNGTVGVSCKNEGNARGNYINVSISSSIAGNRTAYAEFGNSARISGKYTISLDASLTAGVLTQRSETGFVILGTDAVGYDSHNTASSGYILKLKNVPPTGTAANQTDKTKQDQWEINDTGTYITIPVGEWVNITAVVDTENRKAVITIKKEDGTQIYSNTVSINGSGELYGLQTLCGRGIGAISVDTIRVTDNN